MGYLKDLEKETNIQFRYNYMASEKNILSINNFSINFKTKERNVIANQEINLNFLEIMSISNNDFTCFLQRILFSFHN